ncbi:MAG: 2'-5' RNA ligase family protein [Deltaproteobacteria bacterium]|nr:2'-5' RNA ligase family protein [Deltaproteobacteria bacterium]
MSEHSGIKGLLPYEELVVAIPLPAAVCTRLGQAAAALRKTVNPVQMQLFWIPPTAAHISLLYSPRIRQDLVPAVVDLMKGAVAGCAPVAVHVQGLELHQEAGDGGTEAVTAIWARVSGGDEIVALQARLAEVLGEIDAGFAPPRVRLHVPVALADEFRNTREFASAFVEWQDYDFGEVAVGKLEVLGANPRGGDKDRPFTTIETLPFAS